MGVTDLIRRAENGESDDLWRVLLPMLQATAAKKLKERGIPASVADGGDLAQTAIRRFTSTYELKNIKGGAVLWSLLDSIISRRIIDLQRRQFLPGKGGDDSASIPREVKLNDREHDSGGMQADHEEQTSLDDWISQILEELPSEDHRDVLLLIVEDPEMSNVEIGRKIGKGEAAVRRHRAVIRSIIERSNGFDQGDAH